MSVSKLPRRLRPAALTRFVADCRGIAAVEMAIVAPFLIFLVCGIAEMANLLKKHFETSQTASTLADVVARYELVNADSIKAIFDVSERVIGESAFKANGRIILSSVSKAGADDKPVVAWQCSGGGTLVATSAIGAVSKPAKLPSNLTIDAADNVIVSEVFYRYVPLFSLIPLGDITIHKTSVFRPRLGALTSAPGC